MKKLLWTSCLAVAFSWLGLSIAQAWSLEEAAKDDRDARFAHIRPEDMDPVRGKIEGNTLSAPQAIRTVQFDHDQRRSGSNFNVQIGLTAKILDNVDDAFDGG